VGVFLSHVIAELSLKRIGFKRLKIGWFWLIEILLSIIIIKYIENIIESVYHLATGTWSPGQAFEGITGILAIASAFIVGIILYLLYSGKIKVNDIHSTQKFFEIVNLKDLEKELLVDGFRKEIVIVCGPSTEFILAIMGYILRSREIALIEKLSIIGQNLQVSSNFDGLMKPARKEMSTSISKESKERSTESESFPNQYDNLLYYINATFREKYPGVIDIRTTNQSINKGVLFIISYDSNKQNRYTEIYTEPFVLNGVADRQQRVYRFRSTSETTKLVEDTQYDLFELEYSNFLKFWESTATRDKFTNKKKRKDEI